MMNLQVCHASTLFSRKIWKRRKSYLMRISCPMLHRSVFGFGVPMALKCGQTFKERRCTRQVARFTRFPPLLLSNPLNRSALINRTSFVVCESSDGRDRVRSFRYRAFTRELPIVATMVLPDDKIQETIAKAPDTQHETEAALVDSLRTELVVVRTLHTLAGQETGDVRSRHLQQAETAFKTVLKIRKRIALTQQDHDAVEQARRDILSFR